MSEIKFKKVVAFSSQDEIFKADNLLMQTSGSKWLGAKNGDTQQYVVLELEEPSQIHQIDIQNESSAFVEIQVSANSKADEDEFESILPAVSTMTPNESKNKLNSTRVKYFTREDSLVKTLCDEGKKWRFVKIVCTQPFNHELQFGLSYVRLHSKIVLTDESRDALKIKTGVFGLKTESLKIDDAKLNENEKQTPKRSIFDEWKKNEESKMDIEEERKEQVGPARETAASQSDETTKPATATSTRNNQTRAPNPSNKNSSREQILRGVVFALSGFQNPLRSELRDKGVRLGAKYRPDWTDDCTHLVCAFANTPKVNQVKQLTDKKMVTKDWLLECEKERQLLDENDFKLESEDEDDDDDDDANKPRKAARNAQKQLKKLTRKDEFDESFDEEEAENSDDKDFIVNSSEEEEEDYKMSASTSSSSSSSSISESFDSDDSENVKKKKSKKPKKAQKRKQVEKKTKKAKKDKTKKKKSSSSSSSASSSESDIDLEEYKRKKEKELSEKKNKKAPLNELNANKGPSKPKSAKKKAIVYEDDDQEKSSRLKKVDSNKTEINTDSDSERNNHVGTGDWELPTFFQEKNFYLYGQFEPKERKLLTRLIIAFDGKLNEYMSDEIDFVITDKSEWTAEFDQSRSEVSNKSLKIVNSEWILACNKRKKMVAYQPYELTPDV